MKDIGQNRECITAIPENMIARNATSRGIQCNANL